MEEQSKYTAIITDLIKPYLKNTLDCVKRCVELSEQYNITNDQFYIDWENELNKLSIKDHNKK